MENWISDLANKAIRVERINKTAVGNTRQDMTRPVLENLLGQGYSLVTWDAGHSRHSVCVDLDKQVWDLSRFLQGLHHDAPLFERSHPGDVSCTLIVSGDGLPNVRVDSYGNVDENVSVAEAPVAPQKSVAPKRTKTVPIKKEKPKTVRVPQPPEKKYKYVPRKEWDKIKEQPSQHELEKQREQEELDREEWLRDLERETSLKIPNWVKGIIEE